MKRIPIASLMLILGALFSLSAQAKTHDVTVGNNFFSPSNLIIEVGDTVRWTNAASRTHNVRANDGSWTSETSSSFVYERTFNSVEEVLYYCSIHSTPGGSAMNGSISVTEGGANEDPMAAFTFDCTNLNCNFTDQSSDSDGSIASRSWNFGDGGNSSATNPSHAFAAPGTFSVKLTVTDDDGVSDDVSQDVTVTEATIAPSADFTFSCTDLDCSFTDQSMDPDGSIVSWAWGFGDGSSSSAQNPTHSYATSGTYSVLLVATDNSGFEDAVIRNVSVTASQDPILINAAMSDAWYNPLTDGQGFFIIVWDGIDFVFLSWFTFDTERPPEDVTAILGAPGQRWLTAQGPFVGDTATLDVFSSSGGTFDSPTPPVETEKVGTITITWASCNSGILSYNMPSLGLMGEIPIERIVLDNVPACEAAQPMP